MTEKLFSISLFKHKRDNKPRMVERSWQQLLSTFSSPDIREDKDGLLFCPAVFDPPARLKENVKELSLLVLDIDHRADAGMLRAKLQETCWAYAVYSTHSHMRQTDSNPNAEPRYRVCIPLADPIPAKDFPALWQYFKNRTGLPLDESAKDASRMFYAPAKCSSNSVFDYFAGDGGFFDWRIIPVEYFDQDVNRKVAEKTSELPKKETGTANDRAAFDFHEDRHEELCRRIEAAARNTGRGTFEMKCPVHNGKGESSLFYDPKTKTVSCMKEPKCGYFDILKAFGLSAGRLPSREQFERAKTEFEETETPVKSFPRPDDNCFHGLAGDFVRLMEPHTEASEMALLAQFLIYFGNIIGRTAHYKVEGDRHYTNLFGIIVGKTAQGRKGTSFGRVKEIFRGIDFHHETESVTSGLASGEGLLWHIRDAVFEEKTDKKTSSIETVCIDGGITDKRLLVVEGEFAQVLRVQGREGNTLSAFIRNLWDTGTARSMTKNSPLKTTDAHVSIIGHITQTELLTSLSEVESANGYANRFLFIAVERAKFLPFGSEIPKEQIARLQDRIEDAVSFARERGQMNFSMEAARKWASVYERLETSRFGYLAKVTQRASPYVLRLSVIYALLDKSPLIELKHLESALAVWQYAENSARFIFGESLGDRNAEKILSALRESEAEGLSRTEIRDLFDRHIGNEKLNAALSVLQESGLAEPRKLETGGRAKEIWHLCVKSVQSVESPPAQAKGTPFNAYNANNASATDFPTDCPNCGLRLELSKDGNSLFCPMGCGSVAPVTFDPFADKPLHT